MRKSPQAKEELKLLAGKLLLFPSQTRWAGSIMMMNRFLEIWKHVNTVSFLIFINN